MEPMEGLGIAKPEILLPEVNTSYETWAVIACDQFTHDRAYWDETRKLTAEVDSAYHIILPEIDLAEGAARLPLIHETMKRYRDEVLTRRVSAFTYVKRRRSGFTRRGLMLLIDLEAYDFSKDSGALIRATEGVVPERLPPRTAVRRGAVLESPHVLLLIDDPKHTVIEPIDERLEELPRLYDFELMQGGGHITGWEINDPKEEQRIVTALVGLLSPQTQEEKYGADAKDAPLLFAVGDGNHSLAAARVRWLEIRGSIPEDTRATHPARYALVEVNNLHDENLIFEPIHRALFGVDPQAAAESFAMWLQESMGNCGPQAFHLYDANGHSEVFTPNAPSLLHVGSVQGWIDDYLVKNPKASVDYIHGDEEAKALAKGENCLVLLLPTPPKENLFASIARSGPLPRKTFSMGEARDKRYYLECRAL